MDLKATTHERCTKERTLIILFKYTHEYATCCLHQMQHLCPRPSRTVVPRGGGGASIGDGGGDSVSLRAENRGQKPTAACSPTQLNIVWPNNSSVSAAGSRTRAGPNPETRARAAPQEEANGGRCVSWENLPAMKREEYKDFLIKSLAIEH